MMAIAKTGVKIADPETIAQPDVLSTQTTKN
jgi:hypothetical protein